MISFRKADLLDSFKPQQNQKELYDPNLEEEVYVHKAKDPENEWPMPFRGKIVRINTYGGQSYYDVENPLEPNMEPWTMTRDQFDAGPDHPSNLTGCNVSVHNPGPDNDWLHAFNGRIVGHDNEEDTYEVEDQEDNVYHMTRDKFDVTD